MTRAEFEQFLEGQISLIKYWFPNDTEKVAQERIQKLRNYWEGMYNNDRQRLIDHVRMVNLATKS